MNKRKLFFILTTAIMLILTACSGSFSDPGMNDSPGGGSSGGTTGGDGLGGGGFGSGGAGGGGFGGGGTGGGGSGSGGTFTVTGIPSKLNGKYAYIIAANLDNDGTVLMGFQNVNMNATDINSFYKLSRISSGSVSIPMWIVNETQKVVVRYSGNDTVDFVGVAVCNSDDLTDIFYDTDAGKFFYSVIFSKGSATVAWSQGDTTGPSK